MIAYKGFNKDLTCRGFQYVEGETYKHDGEVVRCANGGFHSCESPLDIFSYYPPSESVFHIVEVGGEIDRGSDDTKIASAEITIKAEIKLPELIKKSVDWIMSKVDDSTTQFCDKEKSYASNTGHQSAASNTGDYSAASNTGDYSAVSNTGNRSAASNTGDYSAVSNTGDYSASSVSGLNSVAIATGKDSKAKAVKGSAIVLVYRDKDMNLIHVKSTIIDGKALKADTYYELNSDGDFIESEL